MGHLVQQNGSQLLAAPLPRRCGKQEAASQNAPDNRNRLVGVDQQRDRASDPELQPRRFQGRYLGWALPNVDQSVSALLEDLQVRGLLDSTLVVLVGEFGRSPRISGAGRDHWPACYSAMLAGAGIRGGYVHGSSDRQGAYVRDAAVRPEAFGATLFHALGIAPETRLSPDGFTRPASAGQPILNLFG